MSQYVWKRRSWRRGRESHFSFQMHSLNQTTSTNCASHTTNAQFILISPFHTLYTFNRDSLRFVVSQGSIRLPVNPLMTTMMQSQGGRKASSSSSMSSFILGTSFLLLALLHTTSAFVAPVLSSGKHDTPWLVCRQGWFDGGVKAERGEKKCVTHSIVTCRIPPLFKALLTAPPSNHYNHIYIHPS